VTARIDRDFRSALKWSIGAHAALGFALIFKGIFFPSEPLRIEDAIRVDLIALPDKARSLPMPDAEISTQPISQPQTESSAPAVSDASIGRTESQSASKVPIKKNEKSDSKLDLSAKKNATQAQSLQRLKALERLEEMARKEAAAKALAQLKAQPLKGNQLSNGNSLTGLTRLDHNRYLNSIETRIKQNWRPPKFLARSKLKLRVMIRISSSGEVLSKTILAGSGNGVFDESALNAIDESVPLPSPPETLQALLENQGLEIELDPNANETL